MAAGGYLASYQVIIQAASNTAVRTPSRPSIRFRPKLAASCANSGPITTPRFGEGSGPDARICANQALAASVSSFPDSVRKQAGSTPARLGGRQEKARCRRPRPGDRIVRLAAVQHDIEGRKPTAGLQHAPDLAVESRPIGDVHRHMLQQRGVEKAVVERKV